MRRKRKIQNVAYNYKNQIKNLRVLWDFFKLNANLKPESNFK